MGGWVEEASLLLEEGGGTKSVRGLKSGWSDLWPREVGGWVGGWVEEEGCCTHEIEGGYTMLECMGRVGGWVGGWVGGTLGVLAVGVPQPLELVVGMFPIVQHPIRAVVGSDHLVLFLFYRTAPAFLHGAFGGG